MGEDGTTASLAQVAAILGRPEDQLVELDRRPFRLAFLPAGAHETVIVRDRASGETREVTVAAATGEAVDTVELRRKDAAAAEEVAAVLSSELRAVLLRHPELPALQVEVSRSREAPAERRTLSAAQVVALAQDPTVQRVELAADPEVPDPG